MGHNQGERIGWQAIELGAIVVLLSVVLTAILGAEGGVVIQAIAKNAMTLLKEIPSGTTIGLVALFGLFALYEKRNK